MRAEGPMEHSAQGKRSDTLGPTCWSSRALKGRVFKIGILNASKFRV